MTFASPLSGVPLVFALAVSFLVASSAACQPVTHDCDDPFAEAQPLGFSPSGWATDFCRHSVQYGEIISGGPPRDGIPPIDDPTFVTVREADSWIDDREPVILVQYQGEAKAYPLQILTWHEIVNDEFAGRPIAVTFCPLCYAAVTFERPTVYGELLTFGTTGNLRHSDLVMWDRQTESWWQQFSGETIVGSLTGMTLDAIPAPLTAWRTVKETHPSAQVLSRETGHDRPYGQNPYAGYDDVDKQPFLYRGPVGEQLRPMERITGVIVGEAARAYQLRTLRDRRVVNDELGGAPIAVFWQPGTASAVDDRQIARGADIGTTGVFKREIDGQVLTFERRRRGFTDRETGSRWTILGEATAGPLRGEQLEALVHHDIFWFVWSAFQPEGELYSDDG